MKNKIAVAAVLVVLIGGGLFWYISRNQASLSEEISASIQESKLSESLQEFYQNREYKEVWSNGNKPSKQAEDLVAAIADSKYEGLNPDDYYTKELASFFQENDKNQPKFKSLNRDELVQLDFLLSEAYLKLASNVEVGKVNPADVDENWKMEAKKAEIDPSQLLSELSIGGSVQNSLDQLRPDLELYKKGREVLGKLYAKSKSDTLTWKPVYLDKALEVGESDASIPQLKDRLVYWGFLDQSNVENSALFDDKMEIGLKKFQLANGMADDGKIGNMTVAALNNSTQDLIDAASVNMERLRWLPELPWKEEMVLVNIANFELEYMQNGDTTLSAKIIVGKEYNESPVFTAPMSYIVFSPYWNIPESITRDEIIPSYNKDSGYFRDKNMEVVSNSGEVISEKSVNWNVKSGEPLPFRVRQKPGGDNSLGLVKFMFPNDYNIYIHDTPARSLFSKEQRALSHGCVRIENPALFAKTLLNDSSWDDEKIDEAMHQDKEEAVKLNREIPVVILYLTFWADEYGRAHFREDIYKRDATVLAALKK
jgi:murein L,D-transpeptidase YcbB/YkuD